MRIFISLALITVFSVKARANDDISALKLIYPEVFEKLNEIKPNLTAAALSNGIPNAESFGPFFERLSENFIQACRTLEIAQFSVSAVQPFKIEERFQKIISDFDQTYRERPNRESMKRSLIATQEKLSEYSNDLAPFLFLPFINGTEYVNFIRTHRDDFENVEIVKQLDDYLKRVNGLIGSIQESIGKSRGKIQHDKLKRLGTMILKSVLKFEHLVSEAKDVSSSLTEISNAIDRLRNTGRYFYDMQTYAGKIFDDLDQLKLLLEQQWTDMDSIFRKKWSKRMIQNNSKKINGFKAGIPNRTPS